VKGCLISLLELWQLAKVL